jgi:hypothetical protein
LIWNGYHTKLKSPSLKWNSKLRQRFQSAAPTFASSYQVNVNAKDQTEGKRKSLVPIQCNCLFQQNWGNASKHIHDTRAWMAGQFSFGKEGQVTKPCGWLAGCFCLRARGEQHCDSHPLPKFPHTTQGHTLDPRVAMAVLCSLCSFLLLLPSSLTTLLSRLLPKLPIYMLQTLQERGEQSKSGYARHMLPNRNNSGSGVSFSFQLGVLHYMHTCAISLPHPFFDVSPWWRHCMPSKRHASSVS